MEMTKTVETNLQVDDYFTDPVLKQFYTVDMNKLLENYEPGRPEHKPELLEQMNKMEENRNRLIEENNKMLEAQKTYLANVHKSSNQTQSLELDILKQHYEKQLSDKTYLINELLKKIKSLTIELDECKKLTK
jgi:mevalonate kinase